MNKKGQEGIIAFAGIFLILFFIGGIIGSASFPDFPGRFFICGILLAIFGTGAGALIIKVIFHR